VVVLEPVPEPEAVLELVPLVVVDLVLLVVDLVVGLDVAVLPCAPVLEVTGLEVLLVDCCVLPGVAALSAVEMPNTWEWLAGVWWWRLIGIRTPPAMTTAANSPTLSLAATVGNCLSKTLIIDTILFT